MFKGVRLADRISKIQGGSEQVEAGTMATTLKQRTVDNLTNNRAELPSAYAEEEMSNGIQLNRKVTRSGD